MHLRRLSELPPAGRFLERHLGPSEEDREAMLQVLGLRSLEELVEAALPPASRTSRPLDLPAPAGEGAVLEELAALAAENATFTSLIGMGYSASHTPSVIRRNVLEDPGWYTAYTPYQPEISQGRLEALLNFQTVVADLTGLEVANASLLDEPTAAAEAMSMCHAIAGREGGGRKGAPFLVDEGCHPQTIEVVSTRAAARGIEVVVGDPLADLGRVEPFGLLCQQPTTTGEVRDLGALCEAAHAAGSLVVVAADLLSLALLVPPGEAGADIAVGSAQRFGVPLFYGGPHAAFLATRAAHRRLVPGRIVGVSLDAEGRPALRLALQAREQHIRRERATSNICTAQALLAVVAGCYAAWHGPEGLREIAERVHRCTVVLAEGLRRGGWEVRTRRFFDTLAVHTGADTERVLAAAVRARINLRRLSGEAVGISLDETTTPEVLEAVLAAFSSTAPLGELDARAASPLGPGQLRSSRYLTHPVFTRHRSETEMLRYLRRLRDRDLALDRAMIPLGSCTMKLNAATEMAALSLPGFTDVHPFAPLDQAKGYLRLIADLEGFLAELSGYAAVSVQPNAGSQGELAGLLAIRAYHDARGEPGRRICLIPTSAHGTNAASATMVGLRAVAVACDRSGNVDLGDLAAKVAAHPGEVAAVMLTYPSTHGVYEEAILEIAETVHAAGGQVYLDGANLNALVGLSRLGELGGDVSHFNLHKTFCIPHGGGGPGVGPVGVRAHLAPFLPGSATAPDRRPGARGGAVSGAPFGSAGVLPISWAYMRLMGAEGLTLATETAVLAANYLARRLSGHYPVLYRGRGGFVAHECIVDLRPITARCGVTVEDVAKRLVDYGFHAPTVSFPVAGTLMIEPTESEPKSELDRFCAAMAGIAAEIAEIESGAVALEESALRRAPHTAEVLSAPEWERPYSRESAAFPDRLHAGDKYWPPVARIDNAYGDRNLFCTCPPLPEEERSAAAGEGSRLTGDRTVAHGRAR